MFSVEVKINSQLVGHVYCRNVRDVNIDICEYEYRYYEPETGKVFDGSLNHKRSEGIKVLIRKILVEVEKKE